MTTSSTLKDNPKGGKKAIKPTSTLSTSLKNIMKYGGNTAAVSREGAKKNRASNDQKAENSAKTSNKYGKVDEMETEVEHVGDYTDIDMSLYEDSDAEERTKAVRDTDTGMNYEVMDMDTSVEEIVQRWEAEVENWEKEVAGAATVEFRSLAETKLNNAQLMLKEALLCMTAAADNSKRYDSDGNSVDSDEEGKEVDLTKDDDSKLVNEEINNETEENPIVQAQDHVKQPGAEREKTNQSTRTINGNAESTKATGKSRMTNIINWGDVSDDETIVQTNQEEQWQTVKDKKQHRKQNIERNNINSKELDKTNTMTSDTRKIANPYAKTTNKKGNNINKTSATQAEQGNKSSLTTYLEITKDSMRTKNKTSVRVTMSFTPRTTGYGELTRVAKEILLFGTEVDKDILLLAWNEQTGDGPVHLHDLANPKNLGENIKKYFDKPQYVNFQPGSPVYGIGIHLSTNLTKHEFITRWNLNKQEYKKNNRAAYSISLAPMQNSPTAYIIGIAVGSTEKQEYEILNRKLSEETGINGLEVSFQNINQAGVTQEFWKLANEKASVASKDKYSRDHLREKYRWAPNALAIYVPNREMVAKARKIMISKYGKSVEGSDPIWPDGSSMRFLPIKGAAIKNEKTRNIVRKRLAYHIWLKVHEINIETKFKNIYDTIEEFEGLTFSEIVMKLTNHDNIRVFSHVNRAWTNNPSTERWSISVKAHMYDDAMRVYNNLKDELLEVYGPAINQFFHDTNTGWLDAVKNPVQTQPDDEDDWFEDDDDIDDVVKRGLVDSTFLQFFSAKDDDEDKSSVASWGTGNTTYTEIMTVKENSSTGTSVITQDSNNVSVEEVEKRRDIVRVRLRMRSVPLDEIEQIMAKQQPYELALSGVQLPMWDADKEIFMILAIREQFTSKNNKNDEFKDQE
jgi:hypothetical protein